MPDKKKSGTNIEKLLSEQLPNVFGRKAIPHLLPGIISSKSLANLQSLGQGPEAIKAGRTVIYTKEKFLPWLLKHLKINRKDAA